MFNVKAEDYLEEVLPALLRTHPPQIVSPKTIQVIVADREDCNFAYQLEPDDVHVVRGLSDGVGLLLAFCEEDLLAFSRGQLDLSAAVSEGRLKVYGDENLLVVLADTLQS